MHFFPTLEFNSVKTERCIVLDFAIRYTYTFRTNPENIKSLSNFSPLRWNILKMY